MVLLSSVILQRPSQGSATNQVFSEVNQVSVQANVLRNGLSVAVPDGEDRTKQCCAHTTGQQGRNLSIYSLRLPGP